MRNVFWIALIAVALAAIVGGYVQGITSAKPPPVASLRSSAHEAKNLPPALHALTHGGSGGTVADLFTQDDVVVERTRPAADNLRSEQLSIVVGLCGESIAAESGFLRLSEPLAFIVDPHAAQAPAFAKLVRDPNQTLLVQVTAPPSAVTLASLHRKLGAFDGVAARDARGMAWVLRTSGLIFFDERGDSADSSEFASRRRNARTARRDRRRPQRGGLRVVHALGLPAFPGASAGRLLLRPPSSWMHCGLDESRDVSLVALR